MRRRDVLRGAAGAAALPFASRVASATSQDAYAPLGTVELRGAKEAVVGDDGDTVYVATTDGFATVDVSDPADPSVLVQASSLLADRENGPMTGVYDVKVDGDTMVAVGPANPVREDVFNGVAVYDVSDPAAPELRGGHETGHAIHNAYLDGDTVYLTGTGVRNSPVVVVDLAGDEPEEVARWSRADHDEAWAEVRNSNHDLYVHEDTLYVAHWDAGTWLVDVSDPSQPEYVNHFGHYSLEDLRELDDPQARLELPGNAHYVAVNDDASLLACGAEVWDVSPDDGSRDAPGGIDIWDIADPQRPEKLSFVEPPPTPDPSYRGTWTTSHNFDFDGDRLYTSWYQGGVKVHDVSDPANPEELAWWRRPEESMFWTAQSLGADAEAFVASSMQGGDEYGPGLFTFPDRAGEQADPPSLAADETTTTTDGPTTTETGPATTTTATATTTTDTTTTQSGGGGSGDGGESGGSAPGFGVLAAVAGTSAAALAAWRRRGGLD